MPTPAETLSDPPLEATASNTAAVLADAQRVVVDLRMLPLWVVYNSPSDAPGRHVARLHVAGRAGLYVCALAVAGDTIDEVRAAIPAGLVRIDRAATDESTIVETWL